MTSLLIMAAPRAYERKERNWVFTINNFNEVDQGKVEDLADDERVYRIIAEHEHLFDGTPHIQGYVSFYQPIRRESLEALLGGRAWIEKARGGWRQNVSYCSKEGFVIISKNCDEENDDVQDVYHNVNL